MEKNLPYDRFVLPNGLTTLLYPMDAVLTSYAVLYIRAGAVYENGKERGISHFTEHANVLGTQKYPTSLAMSCAIETLGIQFNGGTGKFDSQYYVRLPSIRLEEGLDFLHQMVFKPVLDEIKVSEERNVVLAEFNDFWHDPESRFEHEVWRKRFGQKEHPYSFRSLGTPKTIETFDRGKVLNWRVKYYHPSNMVLALAGKFDSRKTRNLVSKIFGQEMKGFEVKEPKFVTNNYSNFLLFYQKEKRPQIRVILTFPAFGWRQFPRRKALTLGLLNHIVASGAASRLFQRLREKEKMVYRMGSDFSIYSYLGDFEIYTRVSKEKLISALRVIKEEIDKLLKEGVTLSEVKIAKNYLSAASLMRFDNPSSIAHYLGSQEFDDKEIWLPERYHQERVKITKGEVDQMAREIFDYSKINICLLGDIQKEALKEVEGVFKI